MYCAQRHFQAQHLFDGHHVRVFIAHHRHIVETIHVRHGLQVGLLFGQLFGGAVQQADMRVGALDDFAIHLQHQAQHTVRGRMLWPKVQGVVLNLSHYFIP